MKKWLSKIVCFTLIHIEYNDWNGFIFELFSMEHVDYPPVSLVSFTFGPPYYVRLEMFGLILIDYIDV